MKATELRGKSSEELNKILTDLKEEHFNLRVQKSIGQLENTARKGQIRKDIARVKTVLTELAAEK